MFSGRPPLLARPPHMMPFRPPMMSAVGALPLATQPVAFPYRQPVVVRPAVQPVNKTPLQQHIYSRRTKEPAGPAVTVFIGNITERAPDGMIRLIINSCGTVHNWKRVQGASGRLQAFGFCEFSNPDAALRSIRLLHELLISDKKLVAKVDAKAQLVMDDFKELKRKDLLEAPSKKRPADVKDGQEDYMSVDMLADDGEALKRIKQLLEDYAQDMASYMPRVRRSAQDRNSGEGDSAIIQQEANLEDMDDLEDDKKDIISREIGLFRNKMKRQEEARVLVKQDRDTRGSPAAADEDRKRQLLRYGLGQSRSRSSSCSSAGSGAGRRSCRRTDRWSRSGSDGSRSRSPAGSERRRNSPVVRERITRRKTDAEIYREREQEEENKQLKKLERKAREKEAAYQKRLGTWEAREVKRKKELARNKEHQKEQEQEVLSEAKKLKEFLEDYDDEKDDLKYYRGRELLRRLAARHEEGENDAKDRLLEKSEIEELRNKIALTNPKNPQREFERACLERDLQYQPRIRVQPSSVSSLLLSTPPAALPNTNTNNNTNTTPASNNSQHKSRSQPLHQVVTLDDDSPSPQLSVETAHSSRPDSASVSIESYSVASNFDINHDVSRQEVSPITGVPVEPTQLSSGSPQLQLSCPVQLHGSTAPADRRQNGSGRPVVAAVKRKLSVQDVFESVPPATSANNNNNNNNNNNTVKRRPHTVTAAVSDPKNKEVKKRLVKRLIEKIPVGRTELFEYDVDWDSIDQAMMKRRIRPWISKKIAEYIGEPEPTLVEFICSKILVGSTPQAILDDVHMVLDEEADVFVVKLWRLLIYEIEAKKHGLTK